MKKITVICDRCGKQIDYTHAFSINQERYGIADVYYDNNYKPQLDIKKDLCEKCCLSLEEWFNGFPTEGVLEYDSSSI